MILLNWHLFYEPDAGQFYPVTSSLSAGEHLAPQPHFWTSFVWTNFLVARDTTYQRSNLCKNHVGSQFTSLWMIDCAKLKNIIIFSDSNLWRCLKIVQHPLKYWSWGGQDALIAKPGVNTTSYRWFPGTFETTSTFAFHLRGIYLSILLHFVWEIWRITNHHFGSGSFTLWSYTTNLAHLIIFDFLYGLIQHVGATIYRT